MNNKRTINRTINRNFTVSRDSKHQHFAGIIRNQVLGEEFSLPDFDFSFDRYDRDDNTFYLLSADHCVGVCRVIARCDSGHLPVEDYLNLRQCFGLTRQADLDVTCEFSRLAILPDYQGAQGSKLLIDAALQQAKERGLNRLIYCSTREKMRAFGVISRRKNVFVQLSDQTFQYAGVEHVTLQAAMVDTRRAFDGQQHKVAVAG